MTADPTALPAAPARNRWALAGMILGVAIWGPGWLLLGVPLAQMAIVIAGIVTSAIGLSKARQVDESGQAVCEGRGFAIAGMVMSSVAAPGILIWLILWILSFSNGGS